MYLEHRKPCWFFETWLARSPDLKTWELSPANPLPAPGPGEDINTSDPDVVEYRGQTYLYYSIGAQQTWAKLKRAVYRVPWVNCGRSVLKSPVTLLSRNPGNDAMK